jgi:hypothetical protein
MASPLSDVGISIKTLEIHRILEEVRNHEARLNKALVEDGKPALRPFFYTREQWDEREQEHATQLEALKPPESEPGGWLDWKRRQAVTRSSYTAFGEALAKAHGRGDTLHMKLAEVQSEKVAIEANVVTVLDMVATALADNRFTIGILRDAVQPLLATIPIGPRDAARQHHIESWLDMISGAWSESPAPPPKIVAAIDDGVVVPIGRGVRVVEKEKPL